MEHPDSPIVLVEFFGALQVAVIQTSGEPPDAGLGRFAALADRLTMPLSSPQQTLLKTLLALHLVRWSTAIVPVPEEARRDLWAMLAADGESLPGAFHDAVASLRRTASHSQLLSRMDPRVASALSYIESHCHRHSLRLDEVAHAVGLSRWHLEHLLKKHTGTRFTRHVTRARLAAAQRQLHDPHLSVKEVAAAAGYLHVSQFTRDFKAAFNATPGEWRRALPRA